MSSAAVPERVGGTTGPTDHRLVSAVRRGDDRAFELLYSRYQRRIAAYVGGMVKDRGRAEDITQEVFVSALRRMRQTERPIAFKPWIYEIARNACIDAYRRGRRAQEVSLDDADDRLSPSDRGRLVATAPGPDAALAAKQDLDHLRGAFGGLSESQHQILVMRELEGRSYEEIGDRTGMSRPAVESTLFRARKRLGEEYDELALGRRCLRIEAIIADGARVGVRDRRKLSGHLAHCRSCRRAAAFAGLDVAVPARRRLAEKIPAWLPLPAFLRLRRGDDPLSVAGSGWMAHVPSLAEPLSTGWSKAAAGLAALLVAGAGVGVTTSTGGDERGTGFRPPVEQTSGAAGSGAAPRPAMTGAAAGRAPAAESGTTATKQRAGNAARSGAPGSSGQGTPTPAAGGTGDPAVGGPDNPAAGGPDNPAAGDNGSNTRGGGGAAVPRTPALPVPGKDLPAVGAPVVPGVDLPAVNGGGPVQDVTDTVQGRGPVRDAVEDVTEGPVRDAVEDVTDTVQGAGQSAKPTVQDTVDDAGAAAGDPAHVVPNAGKAVDDAAASPGAAGDGSSTRVGDPLKP